MPPSGVIDEDLAHSTRCNAEKVSPILPFDPVLVDQLEICLMHERRRLERMGWRFSGHNGPSDPPKFTVDRFVKPIVDALSFGPGRTDAKQELRKVRPRAVFHRPSFGFRIEGLAWLLRLSSH